MPEQQEEPTAVTAGEENHEDPWALAGADADAPADTGRPADEPEGSDA
ncbi:hypothetical protein ABZ215_13475 [Amycolatopsis sp. NPDC006131]